MAELNADVLLQTMLDAFTASIKARGEQVAPELLTEAKHAFAGIVQRCQQIQKMLAKKAIDEAAAKEMWQVQKEDMHMQILTYSGISEVLLQDSINAALAALRDTLNAALPFKLL